MGFRDFPPRPISTGNAKLDAWLDLLGQRQNIDDQIELTSLAAADEFYVFDDSTKSTKKVKNSNMGGGGGGGGGTVTDVSLGAPQKPGSNFAGGSFDIWDVENAGNVSATSFPFFSQVQTATVATTISLPVCIRAWVPNTVTSGRSFQLQGSVNDTDAAVVLTANTLFWSIEEFAD